MYPNPSNGIQSQIKLIGYNMKKIIFVLILIFMFNSCEKVGKYECVCYINNTQEYDKYSILNKKEESKQYCSSLSTETTTCKITE